MDKQTYKHGKSLINGLSQCYVPGSTEQVDFARLYKSIQIKSVKLDEHARAALRHTMFYTVDYTRNPDEDDHENYLMHQFAQDFIVTLLKERNPDSNEVIGITTKDGEYHEIHLLDDDDTEDTSS